MASNYPTSLDTTATLPAAADVGETLAVFPHSELHGNANDAIIAIQTELGIAPSGSYATVKNRLDSLEGSWNAVTLTNDWVTVSGYDALRYRKIGDEVTLYGAIQDGTAAIGTLPSGFRPAAKVGQFAGTVNDVSGDIQALTIVTVSSAGVINFEAASGVSGTIVPPLAPPVFLFINMVFEAV